ncbi:MAG: hypothetical protein SGPRY_012076 [Prymnesium sp.]
MRAKFTAPEAAIHYYVVKFDPSTLSWGDFRGKVGIGEDDFGKALLAAGLTEEKIKAWSVDPQVNLPGGSKGSIFDNLEDMDQAACIAKCAEISSFN